MTDYGALLGQLAVPRLVGTANHVRTRAILTRELTARGLAVEEHGFNGRPSRALFGMPGVVQGVNLIGQRPSGRQAIRPSVWLVAHYDSKGQPISMALRLIGAAAAALGVAGLALAAAAGWPLWPALAVLAAGAAVMLCNRVTDGSPGAVDNASALVAILMVIDAIARPDVGVVFTDAEELGLLGARALAADRPELLRGTAVVNFDGLDDGGRPIVVVHRAGPVGRRVARELGIRWARWLPVVVDGMALRPAAERVTVMRGNWRTAWVVHTTRDTVQRLTLSGARAVAGGVARALARP